MDSVWSICDDSQGLVDSQELVGFKDMEEESQETGKNGGWKLDSDGSQMLVAIQFFSWQLLL